MSAVISGAEYVAAIEARVSDRRSRAAFQRLALQLALAQGRLFDFGCGPGLDARFYAEQGLSVGAYDVDAGMCAHFRSYCAGGLSRGQIELAEGSYDDFLDGHLPTRSDYPLITSNFAPLNLVADLQALLARFAALLAPRGRVLASLLNPFHFGDCRYAWWWRNLPALFMKGQYSVPGAQAPITRYTLKRVATLAAPMLTLEAAHHAHPASRFCFLQLRRVDA